MIVFIHKIPAKQLVKLTPTFSMHSGSCSAIVSNYDVTLHEHKEVFMLRKLIVMSELIRWLRVELKMVA